MYARRRIPVKHSGAANRAVFIRTAFRSFRPFLRSHPPTMEEIGEKKTFFEIGLEAV
jgi:hypothetical protein